jgi:hypothetical protein
MMMIIVMIMMTMMVVVVAVVVVVVVMVVVVVVVVHLLQLRQLVIRPSRANHQSEQRFLDSNCNTQTKETSNKERPDNEGDGDVFDGCRPLVESARVHLK